MLQLYQMTKYRIKLNFNYTLQFPLSAQLGKTFKVLARKILRFEDYNGM